MFDQFYNRQVTLQVNNGSYVCAERGGGREVNANRKAASTWETFTVMPAGSYISLMASNGQYVCAEGAGGGKVNANRDVAQAWEMFTPLDRGNNRFALRTYNGHYLCAEGGGGRELNATRTKPDAWETFTFAVVGAPWGTNLYYDPGTWRVWWLDPNNVLHWVVSPAALKQWFGAAVPKSSPILNVRAIGANIDATTNPFAAQLKSWSYKGPHALGGGTILRGIGTYHYWWVDPSHVIHWITKPELVNRYWGSMQNFRWVQLHDLDYYIVGPNIDGVWLPPPGQTSSGQPGQWQAPTSNPGGPNPPPPKGGGTGGGDNLWGLDPNPVGPVTTVTNPTGPPPRPAPPPLIPR